MFRRAYSRRRSPSPIPTTRATCWVTANVRERPSCAGRFATTPISRPQHGGTFNTGGGAWNNLEDLIDTYWDSTESANVGDTLYVVVGAYYKTWTDSYGNTASPKKAAFGGQQAGVPTMFYYAMLRTKNAKSGKSVLRCSREELQCAAFVMSHAMQKGHKPSRSDMRSVAEVERLSGFQFFTNVPNAPKDTYNPSDWGL